MSTIIKRRAPLRPVTEPIELITQMTNGGSGRALYAKPHTWASAVMHIGIGTHANSAFDKGLTLKPEDVRTLAEALVELAGQIEKGKR